MATFLYCRISQKKQNIERQKRNLKEAFPDGVLVEEAFTGTTIDRPEWTKLCSHVAAGDTIAFEPWPTYDPAQLVEDVVEIVVQINGKVKAKLNISVDADKDSVIAQAKQEQNIAALIDGKTVVKEIYVPKKLVNIVVK